MELQPLSPLPAESGADRHRSPPALLLNFLPGLLAGPLLTGFLFFLNPDLPFGPGPLLRGGLLYGGLLAMASFLLLTPWTWRRPERCRRALPWALTVVLALAAGGGWLVASRYSYYLPPGINVRIIKAAFWLSLLTLAVFYTALLHTLQRRTYGVRSTVGLALMALAAVWVVGERREAFKPRPEPAPLPSLVERGPRPTLYVVGIDGATLDVILPLARTGRLPFFARLVETGAYARLRSFSPPRGAALWTTVATGKLPYKHGIFGERVYPGGPLAANAVLRLVPERLGFAAWGTFGERSERVSAELRSSLVLWEILGRLGLSAGAVGWPASHPPRAEGAFTFSERYFEGEFSAASARPAELTERGVLFKVGASEVDPSILAPAGGPLPLAALEALAADLWRESLTGFLLDQRREVQAVFLRLPGLAEVSRRQFGGYAAVQFAGTPREPYQSAARLLAAYYRHLDDFLAELWARRPGPRILAVVSAHGFEAPEGWRRVLAHLSGRSLEGSTAGPPDGVLLLAGEGIAAGVFVERAELVDVMPTLLYALGFPVARDLDGRVLTGVFAAPFIAGHSLAFVPSYETLVLSGPLAVPAEPGPAPAESPDRTEH